MEFDAIQKDCHHMNAAYEYGTTLGLEQPETRWCDPQSVHSWNVKKADYWEGKDKVPQNNSQQAKLFIYNVKQWETTADETHSL